MSPLPSINQAYAMVMGDESQRSVSAMNGILGANPMSHTGNYESVMYNRTSGNQKFTRNCHLYCEVCKIRGHNKDNCWKIVGYPPEFKFKKKKFSEGGSAAYNVSAKENTQNEVLRLKMDNLSSSMVLIQMCLIMEKVQVAWIKFSPNQVKLRPVTLHKNNTII